MQAKKFVKESWPHFLFLFIFFPPSPKWYKKQCILIEQKMVTEWEKTERTIPELSELVRKKNKKIWKLEKWVWLDPSRELIFLCKHFMNAMKLTDLNESSSRRLLQKETDHPAYLLSIHIYRASILCFKLTCYWHWYGHRCQNKVLNWDANN